jgi:hypothetical protein
MDKLIIGTMLLVATIFAIVALGQAQMLPF